MFQIVGEWKDFTVLTKLQPRSQGFSLEGALGTRLTKLIKNLYGLYKNLYGLGECCFDIWKVCMDFEPVFEVYNLVSVHPKGIKLLR